MAIWKFFENFWNLFGGLGTWVRFWRLGKGFRLGKGNFVFWPFDPCHLYRNFALSNIVHPLGGVLLSLFKGSDVTLLSYGHLNFWNPGTKHYELVQNLFMTSYASGNGIKWNLGLSFKFQKLLGQASPRNGQVVKDWKYFIGHDEVKKILEKKFSEKFLFSKIWL